MKVANSVNMVSSIARIVTSRTHFGFLSGSHTAEDVFLAAYHPEGDLPVGRNTNMEIHAYMADLLGLERPLAELTGELFAPHTEVFRGAKCSIAEAEGQMPCLTVRKGRRTLRVPAYGSVAYLDGKPLKLRSAVVYIDRNDTFYLRASWAKNSDPANSSGGRRALGRRPAHIGAASGKFFRRLSGPLPDLYGPLRTSVRSPGAVFFGAEV